MPALWHPRLGLPDLPPAIDTAPVEATVSEGRGEVTKLIGPIPGATTPLKQQDLLIGGDLASWGAGVALDAVLPHPHDAQPGIRQELREHGMRAVTAKRDLGTKVHEDIARLLTGQRADPTTETAPYIYAYTSFLAAERPEFLAVEQRLLHPQALFAGTLDFVARIRGRIALGDVKSGRWKASMVLQLAAYSMCRMVGDSLTMDQWHRYWWTGDTADLTPLPRIQDYYVLMLKPDGYELVPVTVTSADRRHYLELVKTFHRMKAWDEGQKALEVAAA